MTTLFTNESSNPKTNAQNNLMGRTHYVDDATLRWHKSRVLSTHVVDNGMLFAIITSDALDMNGTKRGYRYVIFDVFGNTVARPKLEEAFRKKEQASKAMWATLNTLDAYAITFNAMNRALTNYKREMLDLAMAIHKIKQAA